MKSRNGFVSNSSSTSFLVSMKILKEDDPKYLAWQPLYEVFKTFQKEPQGEPVQTVKAMRESLDSNIRWRNKEITKAYANLKKIDALADKIGRKDANALISALLGTYGFDKTLPAKIADIKSQISTYQKEIENTKKRLDILAPLGEDELVYLIDESYHAEQPLCKIAEALVKCGLATTIDIHQT